MIVEKIKRTFGLDVMRAIAILTVVYAHGNSLIEHRYPGISYYNIDGVTIFFVLSGYLIGRILISQAQEAGCSLATLGNFWSRRWLRTLPAYLFVLVSLIILFILLKKELPNRIYLYFIFSQNIAWEHPEFFGEAWSLAVEEWFYLSVPLVLFTIVRSTGVNVKQAMIFIVVGVILGSIAIRFDHLSTESINSVSQWDSALPTKLFTINHVFLV